MSSQDKSTSRRGDNSARGRVNSPTCPCGTCKKEVKGNQKSLQCDLCSHWYHATCQNVDDDTYRIITKDSNADNPHIQWYCLPSCKLLNKKFVNTFTKLENDVAIMQDRIENVDERVMQLEQGQTKIDARLERIEKGRFTGPMIESFADKVRKEIPQADTIHPNLDANEIQSIIDRKAKAQAKEIEDKVRRQTNLIIFQLPEQDSQNEEVQMAADEEHVNDILYSIRARSKAIEFVRLNPLGKAKPGKATGGTVQNNIRPLKISFQSQAARDEVLGAFIRAKRRMKPDDESLVNKVIMRKDLTPAERKENEALYNELKEKQAESVRSGDGAIWKRVKGKIVNVAPPPGAGGDDSEGAGDAPA